MARSYTTNQFGAGIQPKAFRPKTLAEAKQLIVETFAKQGPDGWDERSQRKYMEIKGVEPKDVSSLSVEEARIILAGMERSRMVIFHGDPER